MRATSGLILATLLVAAVTSNLHSVDFRVSTDDKVIDAKSGDLIRINLSENPTTGYKWKFEDPFEKNNGVYSVQMDDFSQEASQEGMVGAKGARTIVIKADKAGSDTFELVYVRSWEYKDFIETQ